MKLGASMDYIKKSSPQKNLCTRERLLEKMATWAVIFPLVFCTAGVRAQTGTAGPQGGVVVGGDNIAKILRDMTFVAFDVLPATAQRRGGFGPPRGYVTAYAGRFVDIGGFSDDQNTFFSYDDATAFGGGLHIRSGQSAFGVDVLYSRPGYKRFDRATLDVIARGEATVLATMAYVIADMPKRLGVR